MLSLVIAKNIGDVFLRHSVYDPAYIARHLGCVDCPDAKSEDYQNCSVLYCVLQLCTVISTLV